MLTCSYFLCKKSHHNLITMLIMTGTVYAHCTMCTTYCEMQNLQGVQWMCSSCGRLVVQVAALALSENEKLALLAPANASKTARWCDTDLEDYLHFLEVPGLQECEEEGGLWLEGSQYISQSVQDEVQGWVQLRVVLLAYGTTSIPLGGPHDPWISHSCRSSRIRSLCT